MAKGLDTRHHPGRRVGRDLFLAGVSMPVPGQKVRADEVPDVAYGFSLNDWFHDGATPSELLSEDCGTWTKDQYEDWING